MNDPGSRRVASYKEKPGSDIVKQGVLKKLKVRESLHIHVQSLHKRYFVLRSTSSSGPARLEYHDSVKKFNAHHVPTKSIHLYTCFNINQRTDAKQKLVIMIYLPSEYLSLVAETEEEHKDWFNMLLEYQNEYLPDGEQPRTHYEYVWQGTIKQKTATSHLKVTGPYRLCLLKKELVLVHLNDMDPAYSFQFSTIRRCGHSNDYFFIEVGRNAVTGSGELWMQMDDNFTAQNMHEVVLQSMATSIRHRSNTGLPSGSQHDPGPRKRVLSDSLPKNGNFRNDRLSVSRINPPVANAHHAPVLLETEHLPESSSEGTLDFSIAEESCKWSNGSSSGDSYSSRNFSQHKNISPGIPVNTSEVSLLTSPEPDLSINEEHLSDDEDIDPGYLQMSPGHSSTTPSPTRSPCPANRSSMSGDYLSMTPGQRSLTSSPLLERTGSVSSDGHAPNQLEGYMDMRPMSTINNVANSSDSYTVMHKSAGNLPLGNMNVASTSGYIDMNPGQRTPTDPGPGYVLMDGGWTRMTLPIPLRPKEPGYIDMGPSNQPLPTVKESGSGEAYLPMSPGQYSPLSSEGLKPAKVVSYLSDESMSEDFPKRAYSVGSRPKPVMRYYQAPDTQRRLPLDSSKSTSAPHLIAQKTRAQYLDALSRNSNLDSSSCLSPLSTSIRSDDSFMEMEFYRPRTASDSYGYRPRSSSFSKQYVQGHRPRSSSYGQTSKVNISKLAMEYHTDSLESVRDLSIDMLNRRRSQDSISKVSNSSRQSSSNSLKKLSEEYQAKQNVKASEYMDMEFDRRSITRNTPSPNIQGVLSPKIDMLGYVDMTLGASASKSSSRGVSPSSSAHSPNSSPASSVHSSSGTKVAKTSGKGISKQTFKHPNTPPSVSDNQLKVLASDLKRYEKKSPSSSGRESEDESYVPFQPVINSAGKSQSFEHDNTSPAPRSHPGLNVVHAYSKSCDSSLKSPVVLSSGDKLFILKKDAPAKARRKQENKWDDKIQKNEKRKDDADKPSLKCNVSKGNLNEENGKYVMFEPTDLLEKVPSGPKLDEIDFIPDNDLFSNKVFSNMPQCMIGCPLNASPSPGHQSLGLQSPGHQLLGPQSPRHQSLGPPLPRHQVPGHQASNDYLEYLPGVDESVTAVTKQKTGVKNVTEEQSKNKTLVKLAHHTVKTDHKAESEYCEINLPQEQKQTSEMDLIASKVSDYMLHEPSICADFERILENRRENQNFSYVEFNPAIDKHTETDQDDLDKIPVKSPSKGISFITYATLEPEIRSEIKTDADLPNCVNSKNQENYCHETRFVKSAKNDNFLQCASSSVDNSSHIENSKVKESSAEDTNDESSQLNSVCHKDHLDMCSHQKDNKCVGKTLADKNRNVGNGNKLSIENKDIKLDSKDCISGERQSLTNVGKKMTNKGSVLSNVDTIKEIEKNNYIKLVSNHKAFGKLVIKQTSLKPESQQPVQDEGYVDLDFSEKFKLEKDETEGFNSRGHRKSGNDGFHHMLTGTGNCEMPRDGSRKCSDGKEDIPCPETPKSYISDDCDFPTPETSPSCISDDSSSNGSSPSIREVGSPLKQPVTGRSSTIITVKGQGCGLASLGFAGEGIRKSLPPVKNVSQGVGGCISRPTSATSSSPRNSSETQVIGTRYRKASGPASISSNVAKGDICLNSPTVQSQNVHSSVTAQELHKQKSMPCMNVTPEQNLVSRLNEVQSRHSFTDLSVYEEMSPPGTCPENVNLGSQSQLWQNKELHYADLDLAGSVENMEDKSPRVIKSRHPSSLDDISKTKVTYTEIDYTRTENMKSDNPKSVPDKEVKFSL